MQVLSAEDLSFFDQYGYVRVEQAFDRQVALAVQDDIWAELSEEFGIERHDRGTWRIPPRSPRRAKTSPINEQVASPRFRGAIDDLLGEGNWQEPSNWGGFLVTFPTSHDEPWDVTDKLWHWDRELFRGAPAGLLIFSFFSSVPARGGGTLLLSGSHRLIGAFRDSLSPAELKAAHGKHRKGLYKWHPWLAALTGEAESPADRVASFMGQATEVNGCTVRVVELTGEPGDVVFCHPWMVHAPAVYNHHDHPRMMRTKFFW